ncbi:8878_t:CDS:2 [Cetraspora pellucida]|uniref:8878_t:CDS:1 n=1 Tax=Cetraspora pellucida TaxID=1433469 RepID=A0A9N9IH25_9GLOM|nr:8878_t:CDS:2 [Cetraspora pellucida]
MQKDNRFVMTINKIIADQYSIGEIKMKQKNKTAVWNHWKILKENQNNDQAKDQTEDQVEDQTNGQVEYQSEIDKPHPHVKCNYCPNIFECGIATRMQMHLDINYLGVSENVKSKSKKQTTIPTNILISHASTSLHIPKWLKIILIHNFIDHLSE